MIHVVHQGEGEVSAVYYSISTNAVLFLFEMRGANCGFDEARRRLTMANRLTGQWLAAHGNSTRMGLLRRKMIDEAGELTMYGMNAATFLLLATKVEGKRADSPGYDLDEEPDAENAALDT